MAFFNCCIKTSWLSLAKPCFLSNFWISTSRSNWSSVLKQLATLTLAAFCYSFRKFSSVLIRFRHAKHINFFLPLWLLFSLEKQELVICSRTKFHGIHCVTMKPSVMVWTATTLFEGHNATNMWNKTNYKNYIHYIHYIQKRKAIYTINLEKSEENVDKSV